MTLAEFLLRSSSGQSFYDISLVDGYNLPMAIVLIPSGSLLDVPPNLTNPVCIGSGSLLAANPYSPYTTTDVVLGTNASYPLLLDRTQTSATVAQWCPWELQRLPPSRPMNGMYSYPDNNVVRPIFEPCFSACAHTGSPSDCCTGSYNSPESCKPSAYSRAAKRVCPDAYSYGKCRQPALSLPLVGILTRSQPTMIRRQLSSFLQVVASRWSSVHRDDRRTFSPRTKQPW